MKVNTHPQYFDDAVVTCACGNKFTTGSTMEAIKVDICSNCHPLFTGQQKFVDTLGQVERFQRRVQTSEAKAQVKKQVIEARRAKAAPERGERQSLKDLLMQARKNLKS